MPGSERYKAPSNMWNTNSNEQVGGDGVNDLYRTDVDAADRGCVKGSNFIGEYMFELWKNQCLCDVQLQVDDKSFLAHKIILAAFSDVFCPSQPRIKPTVCIDLPSTTPDAVYQILMYLYTSEMHLTDCNLEAVLNAACFMGITDIVDMIKAILDRPTLENVALYMEIRKRQGMSHSLTDFHKLCQEHFAELVDTRPFLCLKFEELETLLQNPYLLVNSEMDTVRGVISWLEFNPLGRTQHTARLLELINLECVDTAELVRLKEEKQHLFHDISSLEVIMDALIKRAKACNEKAKSGQYTPQGENMNHHCEPSCSVGNTDKANADSRPPRWQQVQPEVQQQVHQDVHVQTSNNASNNQRPANLDSGRGTINLSPAPRTHCVVTPGGVDVVDVTWTEPHSDSESGTSVKSTHGNKSGNASKYSKHRFDDCSKKKTREQARSWGWHPKERRKSTFSDYQSQKSIMRHRVGTQCVQTCMCRSVDMCMCSKIAGSDPQNDSNARVGGQHSTPCCASHCLARCDEQPGSDTCAREACSSSTACDGHAEPVRLDRFFCCKRHSTASALHGLECSCKDIVQTVMPYRM